MEEEQDIMFKALGKVMEKLKQEPENQGLIALADALHDYIQGYTC